MNFSVRFKLFDVVKLLVSLAFKACHHAIVFQLEIKKKKASLSEMGSQIKKPLSATPNNSKTRQDKTKGSKEVFNGLTNL